MIECLAWFSSHWIYFPEVITRTYMVVPSYWQYENLPLLLVSLFWSYDLNIQLLLDFCKEIQPVHSEGDQPWDFFGRNDAKAETPVLWPPDTKSWLIGKDWCWEGLGAGGKGDNRGWDGWMASWTQWVWIWVNSRSWWRTGRPGMLRFMGSQRVGHDWMTELNWTECYWILKHIATRTYYIAYGTLLKVMWQAGWEASSEENGYMYCVIESLHCPPETTAILFFNQLYPNTKEKVFQKNIYYSFSKWSSVKIGK